MEEEFLFDFEDIKSLTQLFELKNIPMSTGSGLSVSFGHFWIKEILCRYFII